MNHKNDPNHVHLIHLYQMRRTVDEYDLDEKERKKSRISDKALIAIEINQEEAESLRECARSSIVSIGLSKNYVTTETIYFF
jgi:hypothetical protein